MALHFNCKCSERKKPAENRDWVITEYMWNSGAFTSGAGEPSDWSTVWCLSCGAVGRTKSKYVYSLKHMSHLDVIEERNRRVGR